jgi:muramoyltetrapeptide carboxypeptidase
MPVMPPYLQVGDTVLVIATARKISREEIEPVTDILQGWGLVVETGENLFGASHQYAGTDEQRAADLQWALDHPRASAIFAARGGYGTMRIIDRVSFGGFEKKPKWIAGYSDITVLHSHLHRLGYCSLHCTMPINFLKHREATLSVKKMLFNEHPSFSIQPHPLNRSGYAEGELVGGNLSVLYALSGSVSEMSLRNKILFLEDLDEYLYHVDRMMMQLKRSGRLERLAGLVVGGMTEMKDNTVPFGATAEEIIADAVKDYDYPVCFNFPAGHQDENLAFYHGKRTKLRVSGDAIAFEY